MPHYFIRPDQVVQGQFALSGDEAHHLIHVLRIKPGAQIDLFDGTGRQYRVRVARIGDGCVFGAVESEHFSAGARARVHLCCAVPKGDRFDWLVEKAAELGIAQITPLITRRSVHKDINAAKIERWKRIALAASKQSGRADIVAVLSPQEFAQSINDSNPRAVRVIPWEGEESESLTAAHVDPGSDVSIFIGPEGGFTLDEIASARAAGIRPVSLGPAILRVETAALIASILILSQAGQYAAGAPDTLSKR